MKKTLVFILAIVMLLSLVPAFASAEDLNADGPFLTLYDAANAEKLAPGKTNEDKDGKIMPLAGYKYDENGFHTISPTYTSNPFTQFAATKPFDLTKNNDAAGNHVFSVTFTVDAFAYKGNQGKDEWICFSITDKQASTPGAPKYQDGLFILCRGNGDGSVQFQPHFDVGGTFDNKSGSFTTKTIPVNAEGKEVYTFIIDYAEGKWTISIKLADETLFPIGLTEDMKVAGKNLHEMFEGFKDKAYFQITAQTGYFDKTDAAKNNVAFTVNSYNGSVPVSMGDDKKDPVSSTEKFADLADPSTIAANKPALVWDKNKTSFSSFDGRGFDFKENADGTVNMKKAEEGETWLTWTIKSSLSYNSADFPFVCLLTKTVDSSASSVISKTYYCAGDTLTADDSHSDSTSYDTDLGGDWKFTVLDGVAYKWGDGRINSLRLHFNPSEVDVAWIGCFRTEKEGMQYAIDYLAEKGITVTTPEVTTKAPRPVKTTKAPATQAPTPDTQAPDTQPAEKSGCKSTVAMIAVIPAMAAAYVFTKKKHD